MPSTKSIEGATLAGYFGTKTDPAPNSTYSLTGPGEPPEPVDPAVASLNPATVTVGDPAFELQVNGSGFNAGSVITWDGGDEPTTFVSATQLTTAIESTGALLPGTVSIAVRNAGGGVSGALPLTISAPV
jgi:hypothetical protein